MEINAMEEDKLRVEQRIIEKDCKSVFRSENKNIRQW